MLPRPDALPNGHHAARGRTAPHGTGGHCCCHEEAGNRGHRDHRATGDPHDGGGLPHGCGRHGGADQNPAIDQYAVDRRPGESVHRTRAGHHDADGPHRTADHHDADDPSPANDRNGGGLRTTVDHHVEGDCRRRIDRHDEGDLHRTTDHRHGSCSRAGDRPGCLAAARVGPRGGRGTGPVSPRFPARHGRSGGAGRRGDRTSDPAPRNAEGWSRFPTDVLLPRGCKDGHLLHAGGTSRPKSGCHRNGCTGGRHSGEDDRRGDDRRRLRRGNRHGRRREPDARSRTLRDRHGGSPHRKNDGCRTKSHTAADADRPGPRYRGGAPRRGPYGAGPARRRRSSWRLRVRRCCPQPGPEGSRTDRCAAGHADSCRCVRGRPCCCCIQPRGPSVSSSRTMLFSS